MSERVECGCTVVIWDYRENEKLEYRIVSQTQKVHYLGKEYHNGRFEMKAEIVLDFGGNGLDCISLESKFGKLLKGKKVGDIISYINDDGEKEKFEVLEIR